MHSVRGLKGVQAFVVVNRPSAPEVPCWPSRPASCQKALLPAVASGAVEGRLLAKTSQLADAPQRLVSVQ